MPTTQTMSVTRALRELKLLKEQIQKLIVESPVAAVVVGRAVPKGYKDIPEFEKAAKAAEQRIGDLIARRNAIKSAVVVSNAKTEIEVAGRNMTVAEAIERKVAAPLEKQWYDRIRNEWHNVNNQFEAARAVYQQKLTEQQQALTSKAGMKPNEDDYQTMTKAFSVTQEPKLVDPLGWNSWLEERQKQFAAFMAEVDIALSESNSRTTIEVTTEV